MHLQDSSALLCMSLLVLADDVFIMPQASSCTWRCNCTGLRHRCQECSHWHE